MPELPEVEVVRQGLQAQLSQATFQSVEVRQPRLRWPIPPDLGASLGDQTVLGISRRSKYLLIEVTTGWLVVHLGMTGSLIWKAHQSQPNQLNGPQTHQQVAGELDELHGEHHARRFIQHDHCIFTLNSGTLTYNDPRRFGAILWHPRSHGPIENFKLFAALGVEPLSPSFTAEHLFRSTRGRGLAIKQFLLSGVSVVGVGNIYCSESLFRAGIRPSKAAKRLSRSEATRLFEEIQATLIEAIRKGGSTLKDFVNSEGQAGYFQLDYFAYGRTGLACKRCSAKIKQITQQQRSTFYCPKCQK